MSFLKSYRDILPPSGDFEISKKINKENVDKQKIIGNCLDFY
jgi:hypothetical protein